MGQGRGACCGGRGAVIVARLQRRTRWEEARDTAGDLARYWRQRLLELWRSVEWRHLVCDRRGHGSWPLGWRERWTYDVAARYSRKVFGQKARYLECRWCGDLTVAS